MWIRLELSSIRIRQTSLGVDATNPVSHLVYTFECKLMRITFASLDRPLHSLGRRQVGASGCQSTP